MVKNAVQISLDNLVAEQKTFLGALADLAMLEENLGCIDGKIIGTGRSDYTQSSTEYQLRVQDNEFVLIDIPGIEGDERKYRQTIKNSLTKAHVIFYVNGSGKKVEKDTLEKIKKYMHDGTSVYAVFNVHCQAKKERIEGIDKTYQEELLEAYKKQQEIVNQTEGELKSFLGKNFKGSVCLNGLLSFCSTAVDSCGSSTIAKDEEKNLRIAQSKFRKEYSDNLDAMQDDSGIYSIQNIIEEKIDHFDEYIFEENIKKLRTRLDDMISDVATLRDKEKAKIKAFLREYDTFEKKCEIAQIDFIHTISRIGRPEVAAAFGPVQEELFSAIEKCGGKMKRVPAEEILERHKNQIAQDILNAVNKKIQTATKEYEEATKEAEERLYKDLQRAQTKFQIEMKTDQLYFDSSWKKGLQFNMKDLTRGAFKVGSYTLSGFTIGSMFPGLGNLIGAAIGFIVGIGMAIWEFFASEAKRINKAKERFKEAIDDQIDEITKEVKKELKSIGLEAQIKQKYSAIQASITAQRKSLHDIDRMLDVVVTALKSKSRKNSMTG